MTLPDQIYDPDWDAVRELAQQALEEEFTQAADSDLQHYVYEAVMTALYGPNIFKIAIQYSESMEDSDDEV